MRLIDERYLVESARKLYKYITYLNSYHVYAVSIMDSAQCRQGSCRLTLQPKHLWDLGDLTNAGLRRSLSKLMKNVNFFS